MHVQDSQVNSLNALGEQVTGFSSLSFGSCTNLDEVRWERDHASSSSCHSISCSSLSTPVVVSDPAGEADTSSAPDGVVVALELSARSTSAMSSSAIVGMEEVESITDGDNTGVVAVEDTGDVVADMDKPVVPK